MKETYINEVRLPAGTLRVYAGPELFAALDYKVFEMADNNLLIPNIGYMSYTPDVHPGEGTCIGTTAVWPMDGAYVSPSIVGSDIGCGMRVHLTSLHKDELADPRLRRKWVKAIERLLPVDAHTRGHFSDIRLEKIVTQGLHGLPKKYVPDSYTPKKATSLTHVENSRFRIEEEALNLLPAPVWHRAHRQLGTLGNGNHFVEIQALEIPEANRSIAEAWGLFDGRIAVMIHSGSRAWGAAVSKLSMEDMTRVMRRQGYGTRDPKLVFAPLEHPVSQAYMNLMYAGLNYAVTNRHLIAYAVREAGKELFGGAFDMRTLYDLMHNYAWEERHDGKAYWVHRKGATRALPPHHPDNPVPYRETGHPALIPGSMGTASYIMAGLPEGRDNYYSICHGAGRIRSRSASRRTVPLRDFAGAMRIGQEDEIVLNHKSLESLLDESPQAYKDVDQIIESVAGAGLAGVVAKCMPLAAVKGV